MTGSGAGHPSVSHWSFSLHPDIMTLPSACLLLGVSAVLLAGGTVSEVSLIVRPDLQQFFSGQSVSLSCEDGQTADGWTVKRTKGTLTETCGASGSDFGVFKDSSCVLDLLSSYTGVYWCETSAGQRSDHINITVNQKEDRAFILEVPALPVAKGSNVTLHCRHKDGSTRAAYFYRNSHIIGEGVKSQKAIIHRVQQSDEGSYWCSTDTSGSSPHSYLRVRDPPLPQPSSHPMTASTSSADGANHTASSPSPSVSLVHLLCHLLVLCPYCVCSILLASICCSRGSGNQDVVSIETTQLGELGDVAADVTTEHEF
ncbi:Fc receptor-like protein 5 [Xiphophorus hellerii]|uniref:Fc receptor-like protein 5 n=1 Tax=Xiphophorus hellerii TaxID=8084 RepID=UPI0013B3D21E|nr:Fc receptor-like protein 5 [Xiphophorus hellerii]